jgi:hypothetical protein
MKCAGICNEHEQEYEHEHIFFLLLPAAEYTVPFFPAISYSKEISSWHFSLRNATILSAIFKLQSLD